jgi:hypothetical protein
MTIYATFDNDGFVSGFWLSDVYGQAGLRTLPVYGDKPAPTEDDPDPQAPVVGSQPNPDCIIPAEAVEITQAQYDDLYQNQHARKWQDGQVVEYTPPAPVPTATDVDRERDRRFTLGAPVDLGSGRTFVADIDDRSVTNITALALNATRAQAAGDTTTIDFRDHANTIQTLAPADVIAMAEQAMTRVSAIYAASWTLKATTPIPADYAADSHWPASA